MKMKERLINHGLIKSMLLALVMLTPFTAWSQTNCGLFIGDYEGYYPNTTPVGVKVTSANASNITHACIKSGTVSFELATRTLTLDNATIDGSIYSYGDLTINLVGDNYVTATDSSAIVGEISAAAQNLTIKGTGSLLTKGTTAYVTDGFNDPTFQNGQSLLLWAGYDANRIYTALYGTQLFSGGNGTSADNSYLIGSNTDLKNLSIYIEEELLTGSCFYKLSDNINCSGLTGFKPIGSSTRPFKGTFDGNSKTISNLSLSNQSNYVGLFGQLGAEGNSGTVKNLFIKDCTFNGIGSYCGAIAGYVASGDIFGCKVTGETTVSCVGESGANGVYAGAIVGGCAGAAFRNNTYEYSVVTSTKIGTDDAVEKKDYIHRGMGKEDSSTGDCDIFTNDGGAVMYTKSVTLPTESAEGQAMGALNGFYAYDNTNGYGILAAPGHATQVIVSPAAGYFIKAVSVTYGAGQTAEVTFVKVEDGGYYYSFIMPDEAATFNVTFETGTSYDLFIGNTQVTSANASNITGDNITTGTVSYNVNTNTLTLNGATINGDIGYYDTDELTIVVNGVNTAGQLTSSNTNQTNLKFKKAENASGVCKLTLSDPDYTCINEFGKVDFGDMYLQTSEPTYYAEGLGLRPRGGYDQHTATITSEPCYPLWIGNTQVTGNNKDHILGSTNTTVRFTPATANSNNTLILDNATLEDFIFYPDNSNLTIALKGTNTSTSFIENPLDNNNSVLYFRKAEGATDCSLAIDVSNSGNNCNNNNSTITGFKGLDLDGCSAVVTNTSTQCVYSGYSLIVDNGGVAIPTKVTIQPYTAYQLWVDGKQVNANNALDIFAGTANAGKVSFTLAGADNGNTLNLNGAELTGSIISGLGDLTINIEGDNTIAVPNTSAVIRSTNGGKLTITKTGTPTLVLSNTRQSYYHAPSIMDFTSFELAEGLYLSNTRAYVSDDYVTPAVYDTYQNTMALIDPNDLDEGSKGIRNVTISTDVNYPIWVAHHRNPVGNGYNIVYTQINDTNKDDILEGDATTATFTPASADKGNTLKLTGASITDAIVTSLPNLTIEFSGNNAIGAGGGNESYIHGFDPNAILTFKALSDNGKITFGGTANGHYSLEGFKDVAFDNAKAEGNSSYITSEKRWSSTLLTVVADVTDYNLTVAGHAVTSLNASDIEGDGITAGTVSFTPDDGTSGNILTLDGANLTSNIESGLDNLTILLKGVNAIQGSTTAIETGIESTNANATLKFTKESNVDGKLTIKTSSDAVYGFSNSSSPTMGEGLCWLPKLNENNLVAEAIVMTSPFASGAGTSESPFLISSYDELKSFAELVNDGTLTTQHVKLNDNISGGSDFTPIGTTYDKPFIGTFDGNGKTISGITYTTTDIQANVGLFAYLGSTGDNGVAGTVKNLELKNCSFTGGNNIGAVAGYVNNGTIDNCVVTSCTVTSGNPQSPYSGGIAGVVYNGTISNCVVTGTESATTTVSAVTTDNANGDSWAGGIVGEIYTYTTNKVEGCKVEGDVIVKSRRVTDTDIAAGAIVGGYGTGNTNETPTFINNTYDYTVVTQLTGANISDDKLGYTPRGFGKGNDVLGQVELAGTKKVKFFVPDHPGYDSSEVVDRTYYLFKDDFYYTLPGYNITFSAKPKNGYKPSLTLSDESIVVNADEILVNEAYDHTEFTFTMPDANLTATLSLIRLLKVGVDGDVQFATGQKWASFYTETEDMYLPDGLMAYIVTAVNTTSATLKAINYVPQSVPVFLEKESTTTTANTSAEGNLLTGTATATAVSSISGTVYALHNNYLMQVTSGSIPEHRAYLVVSSTAAPQLSMIIDGGGTTEIENGKWKIENSEDQENDVWYDLQGRKLLQKPATKGLYIKKGSKVVMK